MGKGRTKTGTKKIEDNKTLMTTFSKRLPGFVKKAYEMGTLTGVDVALLVFSPSGKLIPFSINSRVEDIIAKFVNLPEDKRRIRIENPGHLLEILERIKLENDAIVRQQMASSSGSNSNIGNSKIEELQATITGLENKRDALRQHLRNFSCDNDATMTSRQSFEFCQNRILRALAQVKERKHQLHLQQQQLFNVQMQQELLFDFHQNNYRNMPMLQAPFQTTLGTQQDCSKNGNELYAVVEKYCSGGSFSGQVAERRNSDAVFQPMGFAGFSGGSFSGQEAKRQNPDGVFQPMAGFAGSSGRSFSQQVAERQNLDAVFQPMGFAGFSGGSFSSQVAERQNPDDAFQPMAGFAGFSGRSFSDQVAERQNPDAVFQPMAGFAGFSRRSVSSQVTERQNPDAVFQPMVGFAGFSGRSFSGQVAEQQNPDVDIQPIGFAGFSGGSFSCQVVERQNPVETWDHQICPPTNSWANPPHKFDQFDHTHQSNLIQDCTPAPPQQECTTSSIVNNLMIPSSQSNFEEQSTDLDQADPCSLYLTYII